MKIIIGLALLLGAVVTVYASHHFRYSKGEQESWTNFSTSCIGQHQSPIRIYSSSALPVAIPALEMVGFHNLIPHPIWMTNNGHSVEIKSGKKGYAKVFGALLKGEYEVEGVHFHWGKSNDRGSEHVINDIRFTMEMHIVTRNSQYSELKEAMNHTDGLAVLAFFFDVRERENHALRPIVREMRLIRPEGSRAAMSHSLTLASLLPPDTDLFYTYRGSLTTPPCSEAVTWILFPDPMPVSYHQVQRFRELRSEDEVLVDNYRHLQSIGRRKIFVRRAPQEFEDGIEGMSYYSNPEFWE
ncbi:anhydrase [Nesidiocoris tenuis]|uniref:Carbonic anhydrase n=1 Tax=Nesidiocoris tenuis TaxID=355587 RepID=A0ABN7ATB7_9HEMI|nr:anhydrase [Nesidiocoris tenuis]